MNKDVATALLESELASFRELSYLDLRQIVGKREVRKMTGPDGRMYEIEIEAFWDRRKGGDVRLVVAISSGGWSAFRPLALSFIKSADNEFVGE